MLMSFRAVIDISGAIRTDLLDRGYTARWHVTPNAFRALGRLFIKA